MPFAFMIRLMAFSLVVPCDRAMTLPSMSSISVIPEPFLLASLVPVMKVTGR